MSVNCVNKQKANTFSNLLEIHSQPTVSTNELLYLVSFPINITRILQLFKMFLIATDSSIKRCIKWKFSERWSCEDRAWTFSRRRKREQDKEKARISQRKSRWQGPVQGQVVRSQFHVGATQYVIRLIIFQVRLVGHRVSFRLFWLPLSCIVSYLFLSEATTT